MQASRKELVAITNLYPVPWDPNRASFNRQQFAQIRKTANLRVLVLVPMHEWWANKEHCVDSEDVAYAPYFFLPKLGRRLTPFFQYISLLRKRKWINPTDTDHILASWAFPDAVGVSWFSKKFNVPFSIKVHGTDVNENLEYRPRKDMLVSAANRAKGVFCASQALVDKLVKAGARQSNVTVNYNGVDKAIFYPSEARARDGVHLVFVGSMIPTKGTRELYQAFSELCKQRDITLTMVGKGPDVTLIRGLIERDGLADKITVTGSLPLSQVADSVRTADLLILPSYREGVPNVLLEACACGVPVVSTTVGGIPEIVTADTGVLVEPKDARALRDGISAALDKKWEKEKIIQHSSQFDWAENAKRYLSRIFEDSSNVES